MPSGVAATRKPDSRLFEPSRLPTLGLAVVMTSFSRFMDIRDQP